MGDSSMPAHLTSLIRHFSVQDATDQLPIIPAVMKPSM